MIPLLIIITYHCCYCYYMIAIITMIIMMIIASPRYMCEMLDTRATLQFSDWNQPGAELFRS